jgi:hypothetical protein
MTQLKRTLSFICLVQLHTLQIRKMKKKNKTWFMMIAQEFGGVLF